MGCEERKQNSCLVFITIFHYPEISLGRSSGPLGFPVDTEVHQDLVDPKGLVIASRQRKIPDPGRQSSFHSERSEFFGHGCKENKGHGICLRRNGQRTEWASVTALSVLACCDKTQRLSNSIKKAFN